MRPRLERLLAGVGRAVFGSGPAPRRAPREIGYTAYPVPPGEVDRFKAAVPDAQPAEDLYADMVGHGLRGEARRLAATALALTRANPGCVVMVGNFT
ncbi:MAG: hypothetical protein C0501_26420 [Isosphaera sp.]|nr:hypothetical protein [Isosphaera sp.]